MHQVLQLFILIKLGAFRTFSINKCAMFWESQLYLKKTPVQVNSLSMFPVQPKKFELPELEYSPITDAYDETELLGFPVSINMFDMLETNFRGEIQAKDLMLNLRRKVRMVGRLVTIKYVRTTKKEIMNFGTFIDSTGNFFDTVHFPDSLKNYPFKGSGIYLILGKVVEEFGFPFIEIEKLAKLPIKPNPKA